MMYYTYTTDNGIQAAYYENDGIRISFAFDPANVDFQQYQQWLSEGNVPEPADELRTE